MPSPQVLLNVSRQAGKSTTVGMLAAHKAIYEPGALVILISRGLRQAGELYQKVAAVLAPSRREAHSATTRHRANWRTAHASCRCPATPTAFVGSAPNLVVFDEAAFVDDNVYNAVRPMLSVSRGRLFLISTPNGQRGFFFDEWDQWRARPGIEKW